MVASDCFSRLGSFALTNGEGEPTRALSTVGWDLSHLFGVALRAFR